MSRRRHPHAKASLPANGMTGKFAPLKKVDERTMKLSRELGIQNERTSTELLRVKHYIYLECALWWSRLSVVLPLEGKGRSGAANCESPLKGPTNVYYGSRKIVSRGEISSILKEAQHESALVHGA